MFLRFLQGEEARAARVAFLIQNNSSYLALEAR
jgi:hypothetical protein